MPRKLKPKEVFAYYQEHGLPKNFCPVPFSTLIFEANGNVGMCRRKGAEFKIGDIQKQSYEEIWNGKVLQGIRREFLSGKIKTCSDEIKRDQCNVAADNADLLPFIELSAKQSRPPLKLTPNFNGRCNLECPMCHIWEFPNGLYDQIGFWETLETKILPHLKEIDTFSGEPFLQKDTYRLIELASRINPDITWSFTSNLNWRLSAHIKKHLDLLEIKTFNLSIDSLNEKTYALIRKRGKLATVLETLENLKEYEAQRIAQGKSALGFVLHVVVQLANWREIPHVLAFRKKNGFKIHLKCLLQPEQFSLTTLSEKEKIEVVDFFLDRLAAEDLVTTASVTRVLFEGINSLDKAALVARFQEKISVL